MDEILSASMAGMKLAFTVNLVEYDCCRTVKLRLYFITHNIIYFCQLLSLQKWKEKTLSYHQE